MLGLIQPNALWTAEATAGSPLQLPGQRNRHPLLARTQRQLSGSSYDSIPVHSLCLFEMVWFTLYIIGDRCQEFFVDDFKI